MRKILKYKEDLRVALEQCSRFDVAEATCFLEADRQRLVAVVDAAYGSLYEFNATVRELFKQENAYRLSKSTHKAGKKQATMTTVVR